MRREDLEERLDTEVSHLVTEEALTILEIL